MTVGKRDRKSNPRKGQRSFKYFNPSLKPSSADMVFFLRQLASQHQSDREAASQHKKVAERIAKYNNHLAEVAKTAVPDDSEYAGWRNVQDRKNPSVNNLKEILGQKWRQKLPSLMVLLEYAKAIVSPKERKEKFGNFCYLPTTAETLVLSLGNSMAVSRTVHAASSLGIITCEDFCYEYGENSCAKVYRVDEEAVDKFLGLLRKIGASAGRTYRNYELLTKGVENVNLRKEFGHNSNEWRKIVKKISNVGICSRGCRIDTRTTGITPLMAKLIAEKEFKMSAELSSVIRDVNSQKECVSRILGGLKVMTSHRGRYITGFSNRPYSEAMLLPASSDDETENTCSEYSNRPEMLEDKLCETYSEWDGKSSVPNFRRGIQNAGKLSFDDVYSAFLPTAVVNAAKRQGVWDDIRNGVLKLLALRHNFSSYGDGMVMQAYRQYSRNMDEMREKDSKWSEKKQMEMLAYLFSRICAVLGPGSHDTSIFTLEALTYLQVVDDIQRSGRKIVLVYDCFYFDPSNVSEDEIKSLVKKHFEINYNKYYSQGNLKAA